LIIQCVPLSVCLVFLGDIEGLLAAADFVYIVVQLLSWIWGSSDSSFPRYLAIQTFLMSVPQKPVPEGQRIRLELHPPINY